LRTPARIAVGGRLRWGGDFFGVSLGAGLASPSRLPAARDVVGGIPWSGAPPRQGPGRRCRHKGRSRVPARGASYWPAEPDPAPHVRHAPGPRPGANRPGAVGREPRGGPPRRAEALASEAPPGRLRGEDRHDQDRRRIQSHRAHDRRCGRGYPGDGRLSELPGAGAEHSPGGCRGRVDGACRSPRAPLHGGQHLPGRGCRRREHGAPAIYASEAPLDGRTKYYDLTIQAATASSYTIAAAPKNAQAGDTCGTLTLTHTGARGAAQADCWR